MRKTIFLFIGLIFCMNLFGQLKSGSKEIISSDTVDISVELLNGHSGFQFYDDILLHQIPYIIENDESIGMINYKKYYYSLDTTTLSGKIEYHSIKKNYGDSVAAMSLNCTQIINTFTSSSSMSNVFLFYNENLNDDGATLLLYYRSYRAIIKYIDMDTIKQSLINLDANDPSEALLVYKSNARLIVDIKFLEDILVRDRIKIIKQNNQCSNKRYRFFNKE